MSLAELICGIEDLTEHDVLVLGSHWNKVERAHDLDARAARVAIDALDRLARDDSKRDHLLIYCVGRGGHPVFAQTVSRAAGAHWSTFRVYLPYFCSGFATQLALEADALSLHAYGALGAVDDGNVSVLEARDEGSDFGPLEGPATDEWRRLSRRVAERSIVRNEHAFSVDAFCHASIGREVGYSSRDLKAHGFDVETLDCADAAWTLFNQLEDELGLMQQLAPRYSASDIGDEVEFEMATGLTAGVIETRLDAYRYVMDTGRPHPDTGVYDGDWQQADG